MKKIDRVHVIGLGGIGGTYSSKLFDINSDFVKVIANKDRIEKYKRNKFIINGMNYDFNYVDSETKGEIAELILVCVKYHDLSETINAMKNFVGPDTIILSLLNGISSEEIIGEEFGMEKMLYGMCVGIDAVREENKIRFSSSGKINFGEKTNKIYSPKVEAVREVFDKANIPYVIPEDMIRTLWWKYMINVGINQASAVLRAPYKAFMNIKEARDLMDDAMWEVIRLSEKVGVNLNAKDVADWYKILEKLDPQNKTSMLQDIEAGRKTEVEMFAGQVCKMGDEYGIDTKVNRTLYNIIKTIEIR